MWNDLRGDHSLLGDLRRFSIASRTAIWKIGATMSWHAGFLDAQRQGLDGRAAVRVADSLYRKIQEAGRPGDLSAVERNPYMRELSMFVGPSLIQANNMMEAAHAIQDKGFTAQTAGKALTVLFAGQLVNSVLFNLMRGKGPDDNDKWPSWMLARMSLGLFDGVPILNQGTEYLEGKINGENNEPRLIPALQLMKDSVDATWAALKAARGDSEWSKAITPAARAAGEATGLPMTQPTITGEYLYDLFSGNYVPDHPWSYVTDAFFARHHKN